MLRRIAAAPCADGICEERVRIAVRIGSDEFRIIGHFSRDDRFNYSPFLAVIGFDAHLIVALGQLVGIQRVSIGIELDNMLEIVRGVFHNVLRGSRNLFPGLRLRNDIAVHAGDCHGSGGDGAFVVL